MPYKNPEDRRAKARATAADRRVKDKQRYDSDPEYRARILQQRREYYQRNKDEIKPKVAAYREGRKASLFRSYLKRRYGITFDQWTEMLIAQSGRCAICLDPMVDPHVDHDHSTGSVRGLLCTNCNTGLGKFKDSPDRLASAIQYLLS